MGWRPRLLCFLLLSLSLAAAARAGTVHQEWEISSQMKSPGCGRKLAVTINAQTPEPTIRATQGDTVFIKVKDSLLTENVAIHWHGRPIGTPWADGTEGVTQCPILPGDTFTYTFVVDRPGPSGGKHHHDDATEPFSYDAIHWHGTPWADGSDTYFYHGHYGMMQRSAGLYCVIAVAVAAAPPGPSGGKDDEDATEPFSYDAIHWHGTPWADGSDTFAVHRPGSYFYHGHYGMQCSAGLYGVTAVADAAAPPGPSGGKDDDDAMVPLSFSYDDIHCHGIQQHGTHLECAAPVLSVVLGKTHRFCIASVTPLSALNFETEDQNAPPVTSGSTSSRRLSMADQQYAALLVVVMLCLFLGEFFVALYLAAGHPVADQNSADEVEAVLTQEDSISPASPQPPVLPGSPQPPVVPPAVPAANNDGPLFSFLLALLAYDAAAAVAIVQEFGRIVESWSTAPEVVYGIMTVAAIALLAVGLMAAGWHARGPQIAGGNNNQLSVSTFCARAGAILFTSLLVVAFFCKLGRGACVAAVPSAAVIACIMVAVWIWGDEHAVADAIGCTCCGRREPAAAGDPAEPAAAGDDMV